MMIVIVLLALIAIGILMKKFTDLEDTGVLMAMLSGIALFIAMIMRMVVPYQTHADIQQFLMTKTTIEYARENGIDLEDAAIQLKIISSNQWLAREKYFNSTVWGWWIPDEVDALQPIK